MVGVCTYTFFVNLLTNVKIKAEHHNNVKIDENDIADAFANFFESKIQDIQNEISIDEEVYNGTKKVNADNLNFMTRSNIEEAIKSLKTKNSEGFDRIPQRIIIDGIKYHH